MEMYRRNARLREAAVQRANLARRDRALRLAEMAAGFLREKYGVHRILLFGSLARGEVFDHRSDVDLAVSGLAEDDYYRALSNLMDLDPEIDMDLVMLETARPQLLRRIQAEGKPL
jgi:predicted nucleotidyltransferase